MNMRMEQEQVMYWMRADKKASGVRANDSVRESVLTEWEKSCNDVRIIVYLSSSIIIWAAGAALHRRGRCADLLCGIEWSSWHYVLWTLQYLYSLWICIVVNDKYEEKNEQYHTVAVALLNFLLDQHNGDTSFAPLLILSMALLANLYLLHPNLD